MYFQVKKTTHLHVAQQAQGTDAAVKTTRHRDNVFVTSCAWWVLEEFLVVLISTIEKFLI